MLILVDCQQGPNNVFDDTHRPLVDGTVDTVDDTPDEDDHHTKDDIMCMV